MFNDANKTVITTSSQLSGRLLTSAVKWEQQNNAELTVTGYHRASNHQRTDR